MAEEKKERQMPDMRPGGRTGGPRARFAEVQHAENILGTLRRIWLYYEKEHKLITVILIVVVFGTICEICAPSLQSTAIDIIAGKNDGDLFTYIIWMLCAYLAAGIATLLQSLGCSYLGKRIEKKIREELFAKIVDLPVGYLDSHSHGDVMSRMINDVTSFSDVIAQSLPSLISGALTILGITVVMYCYCWQLASLSLITVFLTIISSKYLTVKVRKYSRKRSELLGQLNGTAEEMIAGYKTVIAYNHQDITCEKFEKNSDQLTSAGIKTDIFAGVMGPVMNCIGNIGFVIIAAFGGYFAFKGIITVGVISAFIIYAKQFSRPVNEIAAIYGQIQTAIAGAERVFFLLDEKSENMEGTECKLDSAANIEFKHVNFSYVPGKPIINDFTLSIPPGKKVALVGSTGCGKTTIANLLMRFYDIDSGEILIDGQNLAEISRPSLRDKVDIVLQDTVLFTDTVKNNLMYTNDEATMDEVKRAVKLSCCENLIENLPDGYETVLTAAGANISQGQRQLLTIARSFVGDPKILILDEATSNVDTRTEKTIQDTMQLVMKNRTSIVIAHRLSTIRDADIIIVMDKGRIVERGNHDSLLAQKGKYYDLYMTQYAGFAT